MKKIVLLLLLVCNFLLVVAQNNTYKLACVAFYNIENLFDTINSPDTHDSEFTPEGSKKWNSEKYYQKLDNMAKVISEIGTDNVPGGPVVIGLSEVENRLVLEDLVKRPLLLSKNYQIIHYESPDERGVDVALLYQPHFFQVTNSKVFHLELPENDKTRDLLLVSGMFDGEMMHFMVDHWPSRGGGQKKSAPKRNLAGMNVRKVVDSLLNENPNSKIVVMGDLNDDPVDESVLVHLNANGNKKKLTDRQLYNPMYEKYKKGIGTLGYNDAWNLFDQMIISQALLNDKTGYVFFKAVVHNKKYLLNTTGEYEGYPHRTFSGDAFLNGYSDHLPVYLLLVKEIK